MSDKATILALAQCLANNQLDATTIDQYFDDVVNNLNEDPWCTTVSLLACAVGQATFVPPTGFVQPLGFAYDDVWLAPATLRELEAFDPQWRDRRGRPAAYVKEGETTDTFRLFPIPDIASHDFSFINGAPMGTDFPTGAVVVVHSEVRDTLPDWLDLPVAFSVMARDYARESAYRDTQFADVCKELSFWFLGLVQ